MLLSALEGCRPAMLHVAMTRLPSWSLLVLGLLVACADAAPVARAPAPAPKPTAAAPAPVEEGTSAPTVLTAEESARDAAAVPGAMAVLAAYSNNRALLTRGGAVVFSSTRDGLPQLYVGDVQHPKDAPRRLPTPPNEQARSAVLSADERSVLFASDVGNDNNFRIYKVGVDGSNLTLLTPGETLHRDPPVIARNKPDVLAYSAHAPASEQVHLFVQSTSGGPARDFYTDARGGFLADLSPDATRALYTQESSDDDVVVYEVDVATGKATRVFPAEGTKARASVAYSATGDRIFVATQSEERGAELLAYDRSTRKVVAKYTEKLLPTGDVDEFVVTTSGDAIVVAVNGGNHSELRVLDARTLALLRTVKTALGEIHVAASTADGKRVTFALSRPEAPVDVYALDVASGTTTILRDEERLGLAAMAPLKASIESIKAHDGLSIPVNLYLPAARAGKLPTLVLVHGGPSGSAKLRWNPDVRFYAAQGYAIVEPNIRGSTGFGVAYQRADDREKRADALKDMGAVNAWARSQPWCDGRLVIAGQSYGGYMTLLAIARQPALWQGGIDLSGMSDLRTMEKLEDQAIRVYDETEFGVLGKEDELLFEWSPLKYVNDIKAPLFVYQGKNDPITPQLEADQIVKALRQRRVPVEYMLLPDEGHGIMRRANRAVFLARTTRFLNDRVRRE